MDDTSSNIKTTYRTMLMNCSPAERLIMAANMSNTGRKLAVAGIKSEFPNLTEAQLRAKLFMRFYKNDFGGNGCLNIMKKMPAMDYSNDKII